MSEIWLRQHNWRSTVGVQAPDQCLHQNSDTGSKVSLDPLRCTVMQHQNKYSSHANELTVVPSSHLPALLSQLHNKLNHPAKSQLKAQFDKCFLALYKQHNQRHWYLSRMTRKVFQNLA